MAAVMAAAATAAWQQPAAPTTAPPAASQQPSEVTATITGERGVQVRLAVPDFIALSNDKETVEAAKTIGRVLWDDINFEHEYALIPRDVYTTVPLAKSIDDVPYDQWRELNADGVVVGTVQKTDTGVRVQVRLFNVKSRQSAFGKEYSGSVANPRIFAHTMSDEIHRSQRALAGVAQTKLVFASDRDGARLAGTVENRNAKELYVADYDGENQRRVTVGFYLNNYAEWSPDARSVAFTSWRLGGASIFVQPLYNGLPVENVGKGNGESFLPSWSPDGTRIAFMSTRDGNPEIYVMNKDGSHVQRLTNNPAIDASPTWSPDGHQIAFVSDRTGQGNPQLYVMESDGLGQHQIAHDSKIDRPTWSSAPFNEIAFAASTGPGFDIKVMDVTTRQIRTVTDGLGSNESPAFSPNGRHIAFTSSRAGKDQIFTINRMGQDLKQITKLGNNQGPNWSNGPGGRQ